jgi:nucleotide-binding universal stress UspA family protein
MIYRKLFCPVDGSEPSNRGVQEALKLAKDQNAEICFVHVVDLGTLMMYPPIIEDLFDSLRERGREILKAAAAAAHSADVKASTKSVEVVTGRAGAIIAEEADQSGADLIVMGTHGRRGFNRLVMGSDAAVVIGSTAKPILLVK